MVDVKAIRAEQAKRYSGKELISAVRTEVHAALQLEQPHPGREKGEAPDDHHQRQKAHGRSLWEETDRLLVADATGVA